MLREGAFAVTDESEGTVTIYRIGRSAFFVLALVAALAACSKPVNSSGAATGAAPRSTPGLALISEVGVFLKSHSDLGRPVASQDVADWSNGRRQRVSFDSGRSLLFYTEGGRVVTVWEDTPGRGRVVIWGEASSPRTAAVKERPAEADLPAYRVLSAVNKVSGAGRFGDVLVAGMSRNTSARKREALARRIGTKEGLSSVSLYSTEEAYKANISESFSKAHPNAMRRGYLGSLDGNTFTPAEALYP